MRPFSTLTNSPNPGGDRQLKPTLDRVDPTGKTAAGAGAAVPQPTGDMEQPDLEENSLPVAAAAHCAKAAGHGAAGMC